MDGLRRGTVWINRHSADGVFFRRSCRFVHVAWHVAIRFGGSVYVAAYLLFVEKGIDVGGHVGAVPVLSADDFAVESSTAGDDVRVGIHGSAVGERDLFRWVTVSRESDVVHF